MYKISASQNGNDLGQLSFCIGRFRAEPTDLPHTILAHFSSALVLECVRLSLLKTLNTLVNQRKINRFPAKFAQKIPTKSAVFTHCFSAKLAANISAKSVPDNPAKVYFRDQSEAL